MNEWSFDYSLVLTKKLKKLRHKNKNQFEIVWKKIEEVKDIIKTHPDHYQKLGNEFSGFRRVHIDKHFVLIFSVDKNGCLIKFVDYDHHDKIYE